MPVSYERSMLKSDEEKLYSGKGSGFVLLKILYCNGHLNASFEESFCEVEPEPVTLFHFLSIFRRGAEILKTLYDSSENDLGEEQPLREKEAMQKLLGFLYKIGAHCRQIASSKAISETDWTLQLCKHLLQELGSGEFIVDDLSPGLGQVGSLEYRTCPCCQEQLTGGSTDNLLIGQGKVWHGRLDVVFLGPKGDAETPVKIEASPDVRYGKQSIIGKAEIIAQSIVFSHYMKKTRSHLKNYLIPTITLTRNQVLFTFYDSVDDMLIQSELMNLFYYDACDTQAQLKIDTVVALWLVLNYRMFCSGVCLDMKETGYKANFLVGIPEVRKIYNDELKFGVTIQS